MQKTEDELWRMVASEAGVGVIPDETRAALRARTVDPVKKWSKAETTEDRARVVAGAVGFVRLVYDATPKPARPRWSSEDVTPPMWWGAHCAEVFSRLSAYRLAAMARLGLSAPLSAADIPEFLEEKRKQEVPKGDLLTLRYPGGGGTHRSMRVHQGFDSEEFWGIAAGADTAAHRDKVRQWREAREQPLAYLVVVQEGIVALTSVNPFEALEFLLCNVTPTIPFIRVERLIGRRLIGVGEDEPIGDGPVHLLVGSPKIPARAVAAAYAKLVRGGRGDEKPPRTSLSAGPIEVLAFVEDYRSRAAEAGKRAPMPEVWQAFREQHPDSTIKTSRSFWQTFYTYRKRRAV